MPHTETPRAGAPALILLLAGSLAAAPAPQEAGGTLGGLELRSIDGWGNNRAHPEWGMAGTALQRETTIGYADGLSAPAEAGRPSARAVSNALSVQGALAPETRGPTDFVWQWGQFLDHDIDLTGAAEPPEPFPIAVPVGDEFFDPAQTGNALIPFMRSLHDGGSPRQQVNEITAFIDASNVYGCDVERAAALRGPGGTLATSAGDLLPFNLTGLPNAPDNEPTWFLAGDVRANEQAGLTALHTLFVREHNRLADRLQALGLEPEARFQLARMIVGAEMEAITYREFLPVLLGADALPPYAGYRPEVDPGIENFFSTAAYRFGHSMLSATLLRLDADGSPDPLPLREAFFNPEILKREGIEPILRGLATQRAQVVDTRLVDDVRNFLFGPPGAGGFDLAALNIQRGRDHGLPGYNQARRDYGLQPATSFADVSSDPRIVHRLVDLYESVDDIDAWVGGLAEDRVPGALVGELVRTALVDQFTRLRDGDRFWYQRALPPPLVAYVETLTLARIIKLNTTIGDELPRDIWRTGPLP